MINLVLLIVAGAITLLDALTINWENEQNPLVLALGPWAYLAKAALILLLVWMGFNVKDFRTTLVLLFAVTIGSFGVWSNLWR